jgi:hypothetical protein
MSVWKDEQAMLEKLTPAAQHRAATAVANQIDRLAQMPALPGVTVEATDSGITLSGKHLRRRMLTDPDLRNFGR